MRLCHIVPSLEERHGGPSKSVRALANHLVAPDTDVDLLATLEDGQPCAPAGATDAITPRLFPRVAPRWLARSPGLSAHLRETRYDCVHHHSLWLLTLRYAHAAAARHRVPLVISPRGMMSPWAYQHRRARKRLAELFVHPGAFAAACGWHATSQAEADDIRRLGFTQPICVSPNGVPLPTEAELAAARTHWHETCPATRSRPVALFYSRFHRKKRLRELIDLWLSQPRGNWLLLIVGVAEDYTASDLQAEIIARGAADQVAVFDGLDCPAPYAVASLFVLPSHSENFGLVIAEALAARVPCLVTDTTPWQDLASRQSGWCVSWADYGRALDRALQTAPADLRAAGASGRIWAEQEFSWTRAAGLLREFYRTLQP